MKTIIIIAAALMLLACNEKPCNASNAERIESHSVELLFEKDGCKVYRFEDRDNDIYFTDCRGKTEYERTVHRGKIVTHERVQNETVE